MPNIEIREFDVMVNDTLRRVLNTTDITNVRPGSVVRTIIEAVLAELDIQYYQINRIFQNMDIDTAVGEDLERLIKILQVFRKPATACTCNLVFGRSVAHDAPIIIPAGAVVSTRANGAGEITEFVVAEDTILDAGDLSVTAPAVAKDAGVIYVPINTVVVMNKPIMNIEYVTNPENIYGGSEIETDIELRKRAKNVFSTLGKSTISALESAIAAIPGVQDTICIDCARGVGTADMIVVTTTIPPAEPLKAMIEDVIYETKAAGIDIMAVYPEIVTVNISVNLIDDITDINIIGNAIIEWVSTLGVGDAFIINQLEKAVLNVCIPQADIHTLAPAANVPASGTQIIRCGTITINGVVWDG